ncbi:MAG: adventurous gliding motility protein GltC [Deltaproteobacteria bacterium]|nr:adventurous gliding motility protein GltC [Deltaproteobacteria bacterium]
MKSASLSIVAAVLAGFFFHPGMALAKEKTLDLGPMTLDVDSPQRKRLDAAMEAYQNKRFFTASQGFYNLLQDPEAAEYHDKSEYYLAKCLLHLELYHAALGWFSKILDRGPEHKFYRKTFKWLFKISSNIRDEQLILDYMARASLQKFPRRYKNQFSYLLGKYHYLRGNFPDSRELLAKVSPRSIYYVKAKYLEGIMFYREERHQEAVNTIKAMVKAFYSPDNPSLDETIIEMAVLTIGRIYYQRHRFSLAAKYFSQISRDSENWLESLFELAWTYFRMGDDDKALGALHTLQAPFFANEYYPEALILKAVIYHENCRYEKSREILEQFLAQYKPLREELKSYLRAHAAPEDYYALFEGTSSIGENTLILARVLKLALQDRELRRIRSALKELKDERNVVESSAGRWRGTPLIEALLRELENRKKQLIKRAGKIIQRSFVRAEDQLRDLINQAMRIQLETTLGEKETLEKEMQGMKPPKPISEFEWTSDVDDEHLYWPWEGEYWRDELGTYVYAITRRCPK